MVKSVAMDSIGILIQPFEFDKWQLDIHFFKTWFITAVK